MPLLWLVVAVGDEVAGEEELPQAASAAVASTIASTMAGNLRVPIRVLSLYILTLLFKMANGRIIYLYSNGENSRNAQATIKIRSESGIIQVVFLHQIRRD